MILSRFAQKLEKNGYVARFNSLINVPVFYKQEADEKIERFLECGLDKGKADKSVLHIIAQLEKAKVFVPDENYDQLILNTILQDIPKPYPAILYLIMTEKCNFACDYCFIERYMDQKKTNVMTKEIAKKAIDFYVRQIGLDKSRFSEKKEILFYGGEPLSNFSVVEYCANVIHDYVQKGILPNETNLSMVTNGTFINDEVAKKLNDLGISFSISLDGATPAANSCRKYHNGMPGYSDIIRGLETAKKNGCDVGLSITLSQEALKDGDKIFELIDKYNLKSIGFNILLTDSNYSVPEEYFINVSKFLIEAFKVFRQKGIYEDRVMRKVDAFVNHKIHLQDCAAEGANQLVIAPNGDVGICHGYLSTRETFVTNVDSQDFRMDQDPLFLEWNKRTPLNMKKCLDCMALGTCGGGCALNAKANHQSIWDLDERFCIHSKATIEFLIWDLFDILTKSKNE